MSVRVLYRCPTPTNVLCPCGAVARRLDVLGLEYETRRVPYRRSERPEVAELTKRDRVPVLIDGDQVISDSRRILEHLERLHGDPPSLPERLRARRRRGGTAGDHTDDRGGPA